MLEFGPDGYLYVALGDGAANPQAAQDTESLLGSILRLDVDGAQRYAIPPDNPFVDGGGAPEIWVYGLRNPWRFSIDEATGTLYIGDVGLEAWEEVDAIPLGEGGANLGWPLFEGDTCYQSEDCNASGLTFPIVQHSHDEGCSIIGGYTYHGAAIPELAGHYFYSDWCGGWIRSFRLVEGEATELRDWSDQLERIGSISSFGVDGSGELYVVTSQGTLARIEPVR
jgi:glucose/arabinose dehydrogenase